MNTHILPTIELYDAIRRGESVTFIDPKGDFELSNQMQRMMVRRKIYSVECGRRGVKFLPQQVVRPIYAREGVPSVPRDKGIKVKKMDSSDFLILPKFLRN
jgi:hypothetical protein